MRLTSSLARPLALALVFAAAPALAQGVNASCWNRNVERIDRYYNPPERGDNQFFTTVQQKGNVTLVFGTTVSMREFPVSLYELRTKLQGPIVNTGCNNEYLNNLTYFMPPPTAPEALRGDYKPSAVYPDYETAYVTGWPQVAGITGTSYYRYLDWPYADATGTPYATAADVCASTGTLDSSGCQQCLNTRGYWLNPIAPNLSTATTAAVFSGNFLLFYPPKYNMLKLVYKRLVQGPLLQPLRQASIVANVPRSIGGQGDASGGGILNRKFLPACTGTGRPMQTISTAMDIGGGAASDQPYWFSSTNPLAEMLFNAGYFNSDGANWVPKYFASYTGVRWTPPNTNQFGAIAEVCEGCNQNFIVLFSDGRGDHGNPYCTRDALGFLPAACTAEAQCNFLGLGNERDGDQYLTPTLTPNITGAGKRAKSDASCEGDFADDVARWLRKNPMNPTQTTTLSTITTFAIGIGTNNFGRLSILPEIADAGGGRYIEASDFKTLEAAANDIFTEIVKRTTSFSVAAITTVQTRGSTFAFIPRFLPLQGAVWEGKLFRFKLFNEFAAGCTNGDFNVKNAVNPNGNAKCTDIYLRDGANNFIGEDASGNFVVLDTALAPTPTASTPWPPKDPVVAATPVWEASDVLAKRVEALNAGDTTQRRNIWTVIDTNSDGVYDTRLDFTKANVATIVPLLHIAGNGGSASSDFCNELGARTRRTFATVSQCAEMLIDYIHGQDVMSQNPLNRTSPPPTIRKARPNVLGDILHSSPILVTPPSPSFLCDLGVSTQCLYSLYAPRLTPNDGGGYTDYLTANQYRQQFLLVGANDGMLHAFQAGLDRTGDDPETTAVEASGTHFYDLGTGKELWAFIPPDLLPKLPLYLTGTRHEMFVDGSPMVRDVWVDGSGAAAAIDHRKQKDEFHTVAVVGEREGGRYYFALDVTAPESPQFLWHWPPAGTTQVLDMGETWNDYAPAAPPIGPVAMADAEGPFSIGGVKARERYVVALGGGYDANLMRGRSFHLLDVWTGKSVHRYSALDATSGSDPRLRLYPVAATPTLLDSDGDAIFDALVVGDTGGQVWTLNMQAPGADKTSDGLFDNWFGGRAFVQFAGQALDRVAPFFQFAAAAQLPSGEVRVYLGAGDRDQIRDQAGEKCHLANLRSCVRAGCAVGVQQSVMVSGTQFTKGSWQIGRAGTTDGFALASDSSAYGSDLSGSSAACTDPIDVRLDYSISCGSSNLVSPANQNMVTCDWYKTEPLKECPTPESPGKALNAKVDTTGISPEHGRFYSIRLFGNTNALKPRARPTDADSALKYDTNALTESDLVDADTTLASSSGNGWWVKYLSANEKTSSAALVLAGCVVWNTLTPNTLQISCGEVPADVARLYQADAVSGATSCGTVVTSTRSVTRTAIVPPPMPTPVVAVNPLTGQVTYSGVSLEPGSPPLQIAVGAGDLLGMIHWLEVPRSLHNCRHANPPTCASGL